MKNLHIIFDNVADNATITASSTAGDLTAANLKTDVKTQVHRSVGTSVTYTLTWASDVSLGAVALPATNLSGSATARIRFYNAANAVIADSGTFYAAPGLNLGLWNWSQPINANTFAYGGVAKVSKFFDLHYLARKCVIDLVDTSNPAGYIDCSRIVTGAYWSPQVNAAYGSAITLVDTSERSRTAAGDLVADRGIMHDTLTFDLQSLVESDRAQLMLHLRKVGTARNFFVSHFPEHASSLAEQDGMIYGRRSNQGVRLSYFENYTNTFEIEGW